jgi:hypothetical protein
MFVMIVIFGYQSLWIWCHPSITLDVKSALLESFEQQDAIERESLFLVAEEVARFSVRGCKSQKIIADLFQPTCSEMNNESHSFFTGVLHNESCNVIWPNNFVANVHVERLKNLKIQKKLISIKLKEEATLEQHFDPSHSLKSHIAVSSTVKQGIVIIVIHFLNNWFIEH